MKFYLRARKTEAEWASSLFETTRAITEACFKAIGWCALTAVIKYLSIKGDSQFLMVLSSIMVVLLYIYVIGYFFWQFELKIFSEEEMNRKWKFGDYVLELVAGRSYIVGQGVTP